jgi:secretion/DNA translocation related TadE-like protein
VNGGEEQGSGSLLGLAVIGAFAIVVALTLPLCAGLVRREAVAGAADAAALAAADVAIGISPGVPCVVAGRVALANRATLGACGVDGLVVTVRVNADFLGLPLTATATAGPPDAVSN